jgi:AcrR family transcriptional regulator
MLNMGRQRPRSRFIGAMATKTYASLKRGRGRPQVFDRAAALREAMKLFWERGYEGTSFDDLIGAMGISPSSFYNSFGSKEGLYREATDAYLEESGKWFLGILGDATDTKTAFTRLFQATATRFTRDDLPPGCMISLAGTHVSPTLDAIRDMMAGHRALTQATMAERLRKGIAMGDLPPDTNVDVLAAFYSALARGMAVQARDGATRERLAEIADVAMRAWPEPERKRRGSKSAVGHTKPPNSAI